MSNLGYVNSLEGGLRDAVVGCYIRSFEYTHCESCAVVTLYPGLWTRQVGVRADFFASVVVGLCGGGVSHSSYYERTPSVILHDPAMVVGLLHPFCLQNIDLISIDSRFRS